jgi:SAM-dependent methyltransferase
MNMLDLVRQFGLPPEPWSEGRTIPWDEPGFSRRMLAQHLSQEHDGASRRQELIDRHVHLITGAALGQAHSLVLDLGCGPGFYSHRLAAMGHDCFGIDFAPAAIEYARQEAAARSLEPAWRGSWPRMATLESLCSTGSRAKHCGRRRFTT